MSKTSDSGTIYALQVIPAAIVAVNADGTGLRDIVPGLDGTPDGIRIDAEGSIVYWTNMGSSNKDFSVYDKYDGVIECADLDGRNRKVLVGKGVAGTPKQLVLDKAGGYLYWCDREGMRVMRSRLDGSEVTTLVKTGEHPQDTKNLELWCVGIAIDKDRNHIYWTQKGPDDAGKGRIFRAALTPPDGVSPDKRSDVALMLSNLPEPIDLEIDYEQSVLYWTDRGNLKDGNTLNRARITQDGLDRHEIVARGLKEGIGLVLDLPNRRAFTSDLDGEICVVDIDAPGEQALHRVAKIGPVTGIDYA